MNSEKEVNNASRHPTSSEDKNIRATKTTPTVGNKPVLQQSSSIPPAKTRVSKSFKLLDNFSYQNFRKQCHKTI